MKKIYFLVPVVLLAIFIFFYLTAKNGIEAAAAARQVQIQKDIEARQQKEIEDRKKAYEIANIEAQKRIKEINDKQALEKLQTEQRQAATDARDLAFREKESLSKQVTQLTSDLQVAKDQKTKVEEQIKIQQAQITYLKTAATDAAQTKALYENALQKMDNAEKIFNQNQAAAAAAAAKPPAK